MSVTTFGVDTVSDLTTTSVVRVEGLEPSIPYGRKILSLVRIPIPPHSQSLSADANSFKSFAHGIIVN